MNRQEIEEQVTGRVIEALERGTVPWRRPWSTAGILPTSANTGRPYRGINTWLLSLTAYAEGYGSPYWLTYRQAKTFGGNVKRGEHGTAIIFWKRFETTDRETGEPKTVPLMRTYTVFNLDQTENVTMPKRFAPAEALEPIEPGAAVAAVLAGYVDGPSVRHAAQDRAYYSPADDVITLPALEQWSSAEDYACTLFHELAHSTGHASRLDRFADGGEPAHFGSAQYAREELVAEMAAAMLAAVNGVECETEQSAAYVASWLRALENDHGLVIRAAQYAQKAVDRILGAEPAQESAAA